MKLVKQDIIYIVESIDNVPENSWRGFVITKKDDGVTLEKKASFYSKTGWIIDNNWKGEYVTHWLKPVKDVYVLTEDVLTDIIRYYVAHLSEQDFKRETKYRVEQFIQSITNGK